MTDIFSIQKNILHKENFVKCKCSYSELYSKCKYNLFLQTNWVGHKPQTSYLSVAMK